MSRGSGGSAVVTPHCPNCLAPLTCQQSWLLNLNYLSHVKRIPTGLFRPSVLRKPFRQPHTAQQKSVLPSETFSESDDPPLPPPAPPHVIFSLSSSPGHTFLSSVMWVPWGNPSVGLKQRRSNFAYPMAIGYRPSRCGEQTYLAIIWEREKKTAEPAQGGSSGQAM